MTERPPPGGKIFGIGLSRTGTSSLTRALRLLGYSAVHFPRNRQQIDRHDAATDTPVAAEFEWLDAHYPGSKFIYTVRDLDTWLDSCRRLWRKWKTTRFDPSTFITRLHIQLYGSVDFSRDGFADAYRRHDSRVRRYFAGQSDRLLVLDICSGESGWETLCPFLDRPAPAVPFPRINAASDVDQIVLRLLHEETDLRLVAGITGVSEGYLDELRQGAQFRGHDPRPLLRVDLGDEGHDLARRLSEHFGGVDAAAARLRLQPDSLRLAQDPFKESQGRQIGVPAGGQRSDAQPETPAPQHAKSKDRASVPQRVPDNVPCPCGSGRLYHLCHGRPDSAPLGPVLSDQERLEREIPILGANPAEMKSLHAESNVQRNRYGDALEALEAYCLFIGYPRSGHSLIGALLDAHPDIVLAHELDVLKFLEAGFDREQISYLLIENARRCGATGRRWGAYSYAVPGQWQGRFRTIRILGDKQGGLTSERIAQRPDRLSRLRTLFDDRIKFVHVIRNPFDVIATFSRKSPNSLQNAARLVLNQARANAAIREHLGSERVLDVWHEETLKAPAAGLERVCGHLGVAAEASYIQACSALVRDQATRSRDQASWPPDLLEAITRELRRFDFLSHYSFGD